MFIYEISHPKTNLHSLQFVWVFTFPNLLVCLLCFLLYFFPQGSLINIFCVILYLALKTIKFSFTKSFLISSAWRLKYSVMPPLLHQNSLLVMLSGFSQPPCSVVLIPSKQGYGLNMLPKSLRAAQCSGFLKGTSVPQKANSIQLAMSRQPEFSGLS